MNILYLYREVEKLIDLSEYNKACELVKDKFNIEMGVEFLKNSKHFDSDEVTRDIYKITLRRGSREFSFNFGQSVMDSQYYQDKIKERTYTLNGKARTGNYSIIDLVEYNNGGRPLTLVKGKEPCLYGILSCLTKYDPYSFEDFCGEYGYDLDSRRVLKIYKAVQKEYDNMAKMFSDEELEILSLI